MSIHSKVFEVERPKRHKNTLIAGIGSSDIDIMSHFTDYLEKLAPLKNYRPYIILRRET